MELPLCENHPYVPVCGCGLVNRFINQKRGIPRLCRGDSSSLTFQGVHRGNFIA